jgi:hypothetical protein
MIAGLDGLPQLLATHLAVLVYVCPLQKLLEPLGRAGRQPVEPDKPLVLDVKAVEQGVRVGPLRMGLRPTSLRPLAVVRRQPARPRDNHDGCQASR